MKQRLKQLITQLLWHNVARLRAKHNPKVIVVVGSVGKTGTKTAIATVLSEHFSVQWQEGNYNDLISVPLVFFGLPMPAIYNPLAWVWTIFKIEQRIKEYDYDLVVLELGTDKPGDIADFKNYLKADYGVVTAISPEHMEFFEDLDAVAYEEMAVADLVDKLVVSKDDIDKKYLSEHPDALTYGSSLSDCRYTAGTLTDDLKRPVTFTLQGGVQYKTQTTLIGKHNLPALAAAVLFAHTLELTEPEIMQGLSKINPVPGRLQVLKGQKGSLLLDDSYNASPKAVISALDTLYELSQTNKIAVLGQMNELGKHSKELHKEVGKYCSPRQLKLVVTVGEDANKYLADAAEKRGCKVVRCSSPFHAADVIRPLLDKDTAVLCKGSQNGVFTEETVKELLAIHKDESKLVRQSKHWLAIKEKQFQL